MVKKNLFLKVAGVVSLVLGLMAIYERPVDLLEFTYDGPILIKFVIAVITWSLVFLVNYQADIRFVFINRKIVFHLVAFSIVFLFSVLIMYAQNVLFKAPGDMAPTHPILINQTLYSAMWLTLISRCFKVAFDYLDNSKKTAIANEKLLQENTKAQFDLLNQQINPHFLFNSLNTLIDLIDKNNQPAITFVKEFSSIYRYVLTYGTKDLVTLEEELDFVRSYLFILENRFQNKLVIKIDIDEKEHQRKIPPLTLQTLLENAIKHNEISSGFPLVIELSYSSDFIIVKNKIRTREKAPGHGLGLTNLSSRMEYLTGKKVNYSAVNGEFIVTVPLCD